MSNEDRLNEAYDLIHQWYHDEIRSIADAAIEACCGRLVTEPSKEDLAQIPRSLWASARESFVQHRVATGGREHVVAYQERDPSTDPREFLMEWVDETTDSHQFVIYTFKARCVLLASDNEDAYQEAMGDPASTPQAAACMAMRADVLELLEARRDEWEGCNNPDCPLLLDGDAEHVDGACSL